MAQGRGRAVVIGGSMSGLFAAAGLRRAGWDVDIFEKVDAELTGRGAGIVTHPETFALMTALGIDPTRDLGVEIPGRKVLDRFGRAIAAFDCPQTVTSWDRVYRLLRDVFPADRYHRGKDLTRVTNDSPRVAAHFSDGGREEADLLIGADGFRSTVRAQILPQVRPVYAGYVGWRGLVGEEALSQSVHADIFNAMVFALPPGEQILGYPVAGPDNDLRPGHRRYNWVWYRPAEERTELQRMLTDASGRLHALSIPPPLVRADIVRELRDAAETLLPPQFHDVVNLTPQPFLQPIYDMVTPRMAVGRAVIIGDAAFLVRPHVGAGVTKAALDAQALVEALQAHADIDAALAAFEARRLDSNRQMVEHGRELGIYLRPGLRSAAEREAAQRRASPQAVLKEIALLDFLRN